MQGNSGLVALRLAAFSLRSAATLRLGVKAISCVKVVFRSCSAPALRRVSWCCAAYHVPWGRRQDGWDSTGRRSSLCACAESGARSYLPAVWWQTGKGPILSS